MSSYHRKSLQPLKSIIKWPQRLLKGPSQDTHVFLISIASQFFRSNLITDCMVCSVFYSLSLNLNQYFQLGCGVLNTELIKYEFNKIAKLPQEQSKAIEINNKVAPKAVKRPFKRYTCFPNFKCILVFRSNLITDYTLSSFFYSLLLN